MKFKEGKNYRVLMDSSSLRDDFKVNEILTFIKETFSRYDGYTGYFFKDENDKTNFEIIKQKYKEAKYNMPILVFWSVDSRQNNVPVTQNEKGVILVSGSSASVFKMAMEKTTPYEFMLSVLNSERYKNIEKVLSVK